LIKEKRRLYFYDIFNADNGNDDTIIETTINQNPNYKGAFIAIAAAGGEAIDSNTYLTDELGNRLVSEAGELMIL
jgi:hypothetical protein